MNVFNTKQVFLSDELGKTDKAKILEYVVGNKILEVGSGSGIHLNMLEDAFPNAQIQGIDISDAVVHALQMKKQCENHRWNIRQGNATELNFNEEFDTIIFCSVLHEVFSYKSKWGKFSYGPLEEALTSAFSLLNKGGRIIIRDGIMSSDNSMVLIKFLNPDGVKFLQQYCDDFQSRNISYIQVYKNEVHMKMNDAMEFLYTYTWGYEAYECEVQEQYGYLTKEGYEKFINVLWGNEAQIKYSHSYLQDGYTKALKSKVKFMNINEKEIPLPDSNYLLVIEKL